MLPQHEATQWRMRSFFGVIPAIGFVIGIAFFLAFACNRDERRRVRDVIDARRRAESAHGATGLELPRRVRPEPVGQ